MEKGFGDIVTLLKGKTQPRPGKQPDIWQCVGCGDLVGVERFVALGTNLNTRDELGTTPLHKAASEGHREIVAWLLDHGAKLDAKARLQATGQHGATPLHEAIVAGREQVAHLLIERGAKVNARMTDGSTALLLAANAERDDLTKLLLDNGAEVDVPRRDGLTPLLVALLSGHNETARGLLARGADPNRSIELGATVLMLAAGQRLLRAVELLLNAGADAKRRDANSENALHHAVSGFARDMEITIGTEEVIVVGTPEDGLSIVKLLLRAGADPLAQYNDGTTPLALSRALGLSAVERILHQRKKRS